MSKKEKHALKLLRNEKFADAIDEFNLQATNLQKTGDLETAIELCEKGSNIAREHSKYYEGSFCERQLSELHAQLGNRESCLQHLVVFRKWALKCGNRSQEQLSYHVEAWCLQQLYTNGAAELTDIEKAVEAAEKSRELVDKFKNTFKESDTGGTPKIRKADLFILEAQLYDHLGNNSKSMELLETAQKFLSANDKTMRYEVRRNQCSMAPVSRRLDIAEVMEDEAPDEKKAEALIELSHVYIISNRLKDGYQKLATVYISHFKRLSPNEMEESVKRLVILYRLVKYTKILRNPSTESKISLCQLHEAVGDLYDKYYQTLLPKEKKDYRHFVRENILRHYEKMIEYKRNDDDVLRSYLAMALVYGDLEEHSKALDLFEKRLDLLEKKEADRDKIIDTRISVFNCQCKLNYCDLQKKFDALNKDVVLPYHKKELYEAWASHWSEQNQRQEENKWRDLSDEIPDVVVKNEDDETDILFGRLGDDDVLDAVRDENELLLVDNMSEFQLSKRNDKGETRLHLASQKSDNVAEIEMLCRKGCDVNARDNGGWTPLSEAVAHDELENARVLIRYGANVNSRSLESFVSEESQESSSQDRTGLTPLMEACANGFVRIAKLLVDNKADIELRDSRKWNAYQHLRHHIEEKGGSDEQQQFMEFLKSKMGKNPVGSYVPASRPAIPHARNFNMADSPPDDEDSPIILEMENIGSRKRRFSPALSDSHLNSFAAVKRPPRTADVFVRSSKRKGVPPPTAPKRSFSPRASRSSLSPTATIRSAPSVIEDDVQCLGVRKTKAPRVSNSPNPSPRAALSVRTPPTQKVIAQSNQIPVKCIFEVPVGAEKINRVMLPFDRTMTIGETKLRATEHIRHTHWKMGSVWKNGDEDKCLLSDQLQLCHVANGELELVFELNAPPAHEIYEQVAKDVVPEVAERMKLFESENVIDLTNLNISENEMVEVTKTLRMCHRSENIGIQIGCHDFSPEEENNIRQILKDKCQSLKLRNCSAFSNIFKDVTFSLEELEITACDFRDESKLSQVLECVPHLKSLKLNAVRLESQTVSANSGMATAVGKMQHLKHLDLSYNPWITEDCWITILSKTGENLESLTIKDINCEVEFESFWLSGLRKFSAVGAQLRWDSVLELLSVLENLEFVDMRYTNADTDLLAEFEKTMKCKVLF